PCNYTRRLSAFVSVRFTTFFFSSRRRHTRFSRDWSSDVCSSDLHQQNFELQRLSGFFVDHATFLHCVSGLVQFFQGRFQVVANRSEERRVGKERRVGWWPGE